jgi:hypothetical protein
MAQRIVEIEEETGSLLINRPGREPSGFESSEGLAESALQQSMLRGQRAKSIPIVHELLNDNRRTEANSTRFWTVKFTSLAVHERTIKMQIGRSKSDIKVGRAREEVITW